MNRPRNTSLSDLKPGQRATLFPSLGYFDERRGCWRSLVHGRVFTEGQPPLGTRILLRGLKKAMKATPEEVASETFQQRIDGFLTAPGRRRRIVLEIADKHYRLERRTRRNGAFYGALSLPENQFPATPQALGGRSLTKEMNLLQSTDELGTIGATTGKLFVVSPQGLSVISDIDDTIKMTEATSRREMLANTFLRPFEVVEGMAPLYKHWQQLGCDFHYVSSSPWQLYAPLAELCEASDFPAGSMHLRYFRVRDEMFKRFRSVRRSSKVGIIAGILNRLPQRKFLLVGDSGEKDPEIYRFLAKRFPDRISAVLIRNLKSHPLNSKRLRKLRSIGDQTLLKVFENSEEILDVAQRVM
ncbi:MAG: phosphatase domain-containing protein [Aureliella sp.]